MALTKKVVNGFINGNQEDTSRVYYEYKNLLFFVIANYISNVEDCNDVLSETFIKAIENRNSIKDPDSLKTYLTTIAKNEALNFLKSRSREINLSLEDDFIPDYENKGDVLDYLEPLLSKREIQVVYLKAIFGYKWNEIAHYLKASESTVRNIYREAKNKLREEYDGL